MDQDIREMVEDELRERFRNSLKNHPSDTCIAIWSDEDCGDLFAREPDKMGFGSISLGEKFKWAVHARFRWQVHVGDGYRNPFVWIGFQAKKESNHCKLSELPGHHIEIG